VLMALVSTAMAAPLAAWFARRDGVLTAGVRGSEDHALR
jgi:hypothetical protein